MMRVMKLNTVRSKSVRCACWAWAPSEAQVLAALDGKLARFKQPKRVMVVDALPRNVMGKVQKNVLREQFKALYS